MPPLHLPLAQWWGMAQQRLLLWMAEPLFLQQLVRQVSHRLILQTAVVMVLDLRVEVTELATAQRTVRRLRSIRRLLRRTAPRLQHIRPQAQHTALPVQRTVQRHLHIRQQVRPTAQLRLRIHQRAPHIRQRPRLTARRRRHIVRRVPHIRQRRLRILQRAQLTAQLHRPTALHLQHTVRLHRLTHPPRQLTVLRLRLILRRLPRTVLHPPRTRRHLRPIRQHPPHIRRPRQPIHRPRRPTHRRVAMIRKTKWKTK